jgi:hypothetical protein
MSDERTNKNERMLEVGDIVKMNPFTCEKSIDQHSSSPFEGEREIERCVGFRKSLTYPSERFQYVKISNYNNWSREGLLVKGIDYE